MTHRIQQNKLRSSQLQAKPNKTMSVRLLPVHYRPDPNTWVVLMAGAGLLGESPVLDLGLSTLPPPARLIGKQGALPAPLTSLRN